MLEAPTWAELQTALAADEETRAEYGDWNWFQVQQDDNMLYENMQRQTYASQPGTQAYAPQQHSQFDDEGDELYRAPSPIPRRRGGLPQAAAPEPGSRRTLPAAQTTIAAAAPRATPAIVARMSGRRGKKKTIPFYPHCRTSTSYSNTSMML
jgi:hypothetical protein